ncbi:MAG TPA: biopolymer transporter ExbD [Sedimenticola sp.]|nr:biopolymer transporter ExbD [Sedimenticola sp.]
MNLRPNRRPPVEVNLTPLIDVVFLLLIFFMVSTTFEKEAQIKVQLPEAAVPAAAEEPEVLDITVDAQGRFFVNQREVVNRDVETLKRAIRKAAGGKRELPVVITGDANASWQAIMRAMDAASQLGFTNMTFPATMPAQKR